ncbi:MAG: hypothetical protein WCD76_09335, partial [Pyrinomonadaceae bacterium]
DSTGGIGSDARGSCFASGVATDTSFFDAPSRLHEAKRGTPQRSASAAGRELLRREDAGKGIRIFDNTPSGRNEGLFYTKARGRSTLHVGARTHRNPWSASAR